MKKLSLIVAGAVIAGFVGFAGTASAEPTPGGNAFGVYGCDSPSAPDSKNPGKWLKGLKTNETAWTFGLNPKQILDELNEEGTGLVIGNSVPYLENVGAMLDYYCGDPS